MKKIFLVLPLYLTVASCAVTKEYASTGGSRADGIIKLSYEVTSFEAPYVNEQQGLNLARKKCAGWGYKDAESFGGFTRICNEQGINYCRQWLITKEYQCLGSLEK